MRRSIKQFVEICAKTLPISAPIYEFGSFQVPGQEGFADLRPFFPGKKYIGADMRKGLGVDVILNLHNINLPSDSVGTVLILDTLEHVEFPRKAIENIYRIIKPHGILILSSVMNFPIHDHPYDYWRFTPVGFKSLLKSFSFSFVDSLGNPEFPHTILGLASNALIPPNVMDEFMKQHKDWKLCWDGITYTPPLWKRLIKLFVPPITVNLYRKIQKVKE